MKPEPYGKRLLTALALAAFAAAAVADDDDGEQAARESARWQVSLKPDTQVRVGIETDTLEAVSRRPELRAIAEVMALGPLLERRAAVIDARAEVQVAEANLAASRDTFERLRKLHGDNANISGRELAQARSQWRGDSARLEAARARLASLRASLAAEWSKPLAEAALAGDGDIFEALQEGREALAVLTLPDGHRLPDGADTVFLARGNARGTARRATVIGPAAATGGAGQGETWLLRTAAEGLRNGMRLRAWVPLAGQAREGVRLPSAAIVWQGGQPWAYVRDGEETFVRRPVNAVETSGDVWFVTDGFAAGEAVVTAGAQLLLGQELRARIPEEDDD